MKKNYLSTKTVLWLSIAITVIFQLFFLISFHFRGNMMERPPGAPHIMEPKMDYSKFAITTILNFIFVFCLYLLNFKILKSKMDEKEKIVLVIVLSLLCTVAFTFISYRIHIATSAPPPPNFSKPMKGHFLHDLFLMFIVVFSSQLLYLSQKKQQIALKYEALQVENMKTRYETLKNQIDPHFFFNTLSSLYFLIETDAKKAQDYIHTFSSVFRYTLQSKETVSLSEEIDFTKNYASLIQIRYGEQLAIQFDIDEKYGDYEVVPLSIQTLVENAIKHNIISTKQPLTVTIKTNPDNTASVINNLQTKANAEAGAGIGLSNLAERYQLKWQKSIVIKNDGATFSVTIPLIPKKILA